MTNFEKIKAMGVEEMALEIEKFSDMCCINVLCEGCTFRRSNIPCTRGEIVEWLNKEVKE